MKLKTSGGDAARIKRMEAEFASKESQWKALLEDKDEQIRLLT